MDELVKLQETRTRERAEQNVQNAEQNVENAEHQ